MHLLNVFFGVCSLHGGLCPCPSVTTLAVLEYYVLRDARTWSLSSCQIQRVWTNLFVTTKGIQLSHTVQCYITNSLSNSLSTSTLQKRFSHRSTFQAIFSRFLLPIFQSLYCGLERLKKIQVYKYIKRLSLLCCVFANTQLGYHSTPTKPIKATFIVIHMGIFSLHVSVNALTNSQQYEWNIFPLTFHSIIFYKMFSLCD